MSTPSDHDAAAAAEGTRGAAVRSERKSERPSARPGGPQSLVGVVLSGRYLVERLIGQGGMGAVYQAEHTHMRKRLAVKVLHPEMSRLPEVVARFEREAMAAAHIDHPNVAAATDFGKLDDGSFFLVLEYVEGKSLRDAIAEGRLELGRALHIARQMASALGRAHSLGIVHRDLKPENIMLVTRDGEADFVKVLDFGIAKVPVGELGSDSRVPGLALTQLGMVYGTPEYMAPEQALGQPVDARADLYGLGAMLFEMIAGTRPYEHESKVTLLGMHVTAPIPHAGERTPEANVPPDVDAIVTRLLAKEAADRFNDAKALVDTIDSVTAELAAQGRIVEPARAPSSLAHPPRASGPRLAATGAPSASVLAPASERLARSAGVRGPRVMSLAEATRVSFGRARRTAVAWTASASPRTLLTACGGAALLALVVVVVLARGQPAYAPPVRRAAGAATSVKAPIAGDTNGDSIVAEARANIEKGDFATAVEELRGVENSNPNRADAHLLLERGYTGARNAREAMREARLLLSLDANAAGDLKLQEDIRNAALLKESQEDAIPLLESKMGSRGVDILFDVAYGSSARLYPQAAQRAKRSLSTEDVRGLASPALALVLQLREAKSCEGKHALLANARDQGDARLLPTLQQLQATRGCGFLAAGDCYPCMRKDALLSEATSAIQDRASKAP
jgi:serine/threonine protein kinase